jgi:hypothetical protein
MIKKYKLKVQYKYDRFTPVGSRECKMTGFGIINGEPVGSGWLIRDIDD